MIGDLNATSKPHKEYRFVRLTWAFVAFARNFIYRSMFRGNKLFRAVMHVDAVNGTSLDLERNVHQ
jgi:hypothetical protein